MSGEVLPQVVLDNRMAANPLLAEQGGVSTVTNTCCCASTGILGLYKTQEMSRQAM